MNPLSALLPGSLAIEAGVSPGVLNVLGGAVEAGVALSSYVKIRKISFTSSVVVGKKIQVAATNSNLKMVTLELGGKSPVLTSEDVRLDEAVEEGSQFLAFNGQGCVLGMRIYMHESIAEKYLEGLKARGGLCGVAWGGSV
jgi:aldehyde dehydrogenase (NAD+)